MVQNNERVRNSSKHKHLNTNESIVRKAAPLLGLVRNHRFTTSYTRREPIALVRAKFCDANSIEKLSFLQRNAKIKHSRRTGLGHQWETTKANGGTLTHGCSFNMTKIYRGNI
jgi:hypothetical protein